MNDVERIESFNPDYLLVEGNKYYMIKGTDKIEITRQTFINNKLEITRETKNVYKNNRVVEKASNKKLKNRYKLEKPSKEDKERNPNSNKPLNKQG